MEPLNNNSPYIDSTGKRSTLGAEISGGGGGGGGYTLPTASADTKGGVKIGNGLTMTGEVLSADAQIPAHTGADEGKVLSVDASGNLEWSTVSSGGRQYGAPRITASKNIIDVESEEVTG